ncbi:uncharacterized protein SPSK_08552 [Sporothrix schenckii 1099-18]|uniref:STAS domain-containing protein n=1 Tax=Sporothrix schenckii 1099-18 TaxID=1397361 RepID=A0A0F2M7W1_SPOSC|nr:uncharacterized protein SPSK_08552 [Sporothrix schenckii 1099-18]KJR84910.1 hypothetical protein SPSK_08552 [Sporothrix schenckii 1099-18]
MASSSDSLTSSGGSSLRPSFALDAASSSSRDKLDPPRESSPQPSPRTRPTTQFRNDAGYSSYNVDEELRLSQAGPSAAPSESTALLQDVLNDRHCSHAGSCNHGTFSPRPASPALADDNSDTGIDSARDGPSGSIPIIDGLISTITGSRNSSTWRRRLVRNVRSKKMSSSSALAERHGLTDTGSMYLAYYVPSVAWMSQYKLGYLKGDFVAALTIAGIYLPMALSLASNLSHVPAISGLYAFVFNPMIYALLGSCPQMIVGPEAAGSLLVGTVIRASVDSGSGNDADDVLHARICGVITGIAGATVLLAGIARLGFLDSVLSRPFLRGFISAIGFVIFVDQLVPELGLSKLASETASVDHGSTVDKLRFIYSNLDRVHRLTAIIAFVSFAIIMVFRIREIKRRMQPRYLGVAYIPDRLIVVILSAYLAWRLEWDQQGVEILGTVKAASGRAFTFRWPFQASHMSHIRDSMSTSFLIALLGFFESSVAAKSLGGQETFPGIQLSPNRELVALGVANFVGGCFMSLPAFGGYGRSKVNKQTGGKTPMSSVFLSLISLVSILFLLPYFYYLPKPVLCSMISVVAWSLIEEAPSDISFFLRIHAWPEIGLMFIIVLATIFYSLNLGIAIGIGLSLLQVIRHATRPRIQILGRIPGTQRFENAEDHPERLEFIEGCLIVKIPEPLTFANTGELKTRLRRLELYGTSKAHPALPRLRREEHNRNVIFDIHGVTSMDGSGTQVLEEIVRAYRDRGVRVFFSRGPDKAHDVWQQMELSGIVDLIGGETHYVDDVEEALKMTEVEEGSELGIRPPSA